MCIVWYNDIDEVLIIDYRLDQYLYRSIFMII